MSAPSAPSAPVLEGLTADQARALRGSTGRVNIFDGAIRTGKTIVSLVAFVLAVIFARGGTIVVVARTRDSAFRNVFEPLMDPAIFGPIAKHVHYNSGAPTARIMGRTVHVLGASDKKAEKTLRGLTVALAYVDEITVVEEQFFTQLLGRMSPPGAKLFGTTNPDSPAHWFKTKYLDRIAKLTGWKHFHFTLDGATHLSPAYKAAIASEFTGLWYKRFILGEWVAAEGAVFDSWDVDLNTVAWDDLPPMRELLSVGLDYGTTNATSAILVGLSDEFDRYGNRMSRLYLIDEYRHDSREPGAEKLSDARLAAEFEAWLAAIELPNQPNSNKRLTPRHIVLDPSAASLRTELADRRIPSSQAVNDVLYGVRLMSSLISARKLVVARPTDANPERGCPGFINEAPGYAWDEKATAKGRDEPIKVADHSLDAGRYGVVSLEAQWRPYVDMMAQAA